jgi:hypothetical protein
MVYLYNSKSGVGALPLSGTSLPGVGVEGLTESISRIRASKMKMKNKIENRIMIRIRMKMTNRSVVVGHRSPDPARVPDREVSFLRSARITVLVNLRIRQARGRTGRERRSNRTAHGVETQGFVGFGSQRRWVRSFHFAR